MNTQRLGIVVLVVAVIIICTQIPMPYGLVAGILVAFGGYMIDEG